MKLVLGVIFLLVAKVAGAKSPVISEINSAPVQIKFKKSKSLELSGLTHISGSKYLAIGDSASDVYSLSLDLKTLDDGKTKVRAKLKKAFRLKSKKWPKSKKNLLIDDSEGISYDAKSGRIFVAHETTSNIHSYSAGNGKFKNSVALPKEYLKIRRNMGLESVSVDPGDKSLWYANEETLVIDGDISTVNSGGIVRITNTDAKYKAAEQWIYQMDPLRSAKNFRKISKNGVSEVVSLGDGKLLVLERNVGGRVVPVFHSKIYYVDTEKAENVLAKNLGPETLRKKVMSKKLLWQRRFPVNNFEGMALGANLEKNSKILLLISDDGGGLQSSVMPLKISF